jgi:hypothetical protein
MEDLVRRAIAAVAGHPQVEQVELAGSRSRGTHDELSDWDFAITTPDFEAVARDMPTLTQALDPIVAQWEPLGHFPVYQVTLRGPTKVEYLFLDHSQEAAPPRTPSPDTLRAIDGHFWDWIWWIATKARAGRDDLVAEHLPQLHRHLLEPLGVDQPPSTVGEAVEAYTARRDTLEREYGMHVPRDLQHEICGGIARIQRR